MEQCASTASLLASVREQERQFEMLSRALEEERRSCAGTLPRPLPNMQNGRIPCDADIERLTLNEGYINGTHHFRMEPGQVVQETFTVEEQPQEMPPIVSVETSEDGTTKRTETTVKKVVKTTTTRTVIPSVSDTLSVDGGGSVTGGYTTPADRIYRQGPGVPVPMDYPTQTVPRNYHYGPPVGPYDDYRTGPPSEVYTSLNRGAHMDDRYRPVHPDGYRTLDPNYRAPSRNQLDPYAAQPQVGPMGSGMELSSIPRFVPEPYGLEDDQRSMGYDEPDYGMGPPMHYSTVPRNPHAYPRAPPRRTGSYEGLLDGDMSGAGDYYWGGGAPLAQGERGSMASLDSTLRKGPGPGGWRQPELPEVIAMLNYRLDPVRSNAAAYLQHLTYKNDKVKSDVRRLKGIPALVSMLDNPHREVHYAACGALKNISYGKDQDNKIAIKNCDGVPALIRLLRKTHDQDLTDVITGPVSEAPLQNHIHALCEAWWKKGLQEKERFGRTAFFVSLQKSFILKKPGAEIQRVWRLHDVLLSLDYTSEENKQIIDLLLQCFHRPAHIRNDDGKRFLVFLFSWNINFIWVIHGTIKNQLEFYSKPMTTHIAEIYFRAWKKASGEFLEKIESLCIQDFMQNAIFLHRSSPVHSKVRQIVSYFHTRKDCRNVDKMLYNLYRPILWKALSAPNFEVRANSTLLFTEAFPFYDPSESNEKIDENIQKQLDTAMNLLDDPHPTVRSNATLGVCKILAKCWELLPPTIITDFAKKLVAELAADSSSPDVRCSVFKCLTIVLDNALSHPLLEKLLPTLKYSLHDNSEKVRIAFLDMLMKVKAVRAAKFWDVCNMDHLLARLAIDSHSVSKRIVDLLFKSFFPVNESEKEWCNRCITLIQMNPMAARKFYQFAYRHTAPTNIIKLMLAIRRVLNSCIQVDCDMTDINDSNKENSAQASPALLGKDMAIVSSLLEVVVILWRSVSKALKQNEEAQKYTCAKFGSVMSKYFQAFEDERATVPLIQLASFMPPTAVPMFSCGVMSRLRRMDSGAAPTQYSQLLDCICSWGQAANILELITDWLTDSLPKKDKATSGRKVCIMETVEAKPDLALAYLEHLFSHTSTREKVLALGPKPLKQLHTVLGNWKLVLYSHLSSTTEHPKHASVETALSAFKHHSRLGAHLQHNLSDGRDYLLSLEHVAAWVADRVLPFLAKRSDDDSEDSEKSQPQPLAAEITESFLTVCRDVLLVGLGDETFRGQILHLCSLILLSEAGYLCIPAVLPILKEVANSYASEDSKEPEENQEDPTTVILGVVSNIFQKVIELLARRLRKDPEEGKQLCQSAVPGLTDFLQVAQLWDRAPLSGVFSTLFAVIVVEKRHLLQKIEHPEAVIIPESVDDMPPLSRILLSVILKSQPVTRAFLAEVCTSVDSEAIGNLVELAAVLHVLAVIKHAGQSKAGLKSAAVSVQQQLYKHAVTFADSTDVQRVIYESSVKTLNEILHL